MLVQHFDYFEKDNKPLNSKQIRYLMCVCVCVCVYKGKCVSLIWGFPGESLIKNLPDTAGDAGDMGSIPVSRRYPGAGNVNSLQYSCLENSMDRGTWQATVRGITEESDMT